MHFRVAGVRLGYTLHRKRAADGENDEQRSEGKGPTGLNGRKREKRFVMDGGIAKGVGWPREQRRTGKVEKAGHLADESNWGVRLGIYCV